jgi:hypothetical protein
MTMASIVNSTPRADVENFQFYGIFSEDHAKIANPKTAMSRTHRDHHMGE